jgi:hypothetical protein
MRITIFVWIVGIAVAATGCSDGRNMGGSDAGRSQTHTVNRPVDDNNRTSSGASSNSTQTGPGAAGSNVPANTASGGTGTDQSGTTGGGGTAPAGK